MTKLPNRRDGYNQKCKIYSNTGEKTVYIRTGEHPAGILREVRIDIDKEGTFINGILDCFCILLNITLQRDINCNDLAEEDNSLLEKIGEQFIFSKFEPSGLVKGHAYIKNCTSPLDLIFRDLLITYCNREDLKHTI
jgi:ribonucleoside-diphosphate reductase alpha chain